MTNDLSALLPRILAAGMLTVLRPMCWMPRLVNGDYTADFAKQGDTVNIYVPAAQTAADVVPSNVSPAPANKTPTSIPLTLDHWKMTDFGLTDRDMGNIMARERFLPGQVVEAFKALSTAVNQSLWAQYKGVYGYVGTAGTTPFASDVTAATGVRRVLHTQMAPRDNRSLVLDFAAEANALALAAYADADKSGDGGALKTNGEIGRKYGMYHVADDHVPTHTAGTGSGYLVNKLGGHAVGDDDITVDTGTGTILVGDIVTFAGHTQTYTVTAALAANVFSISPPLVAAVADNAAITLKASHVVNMGFHRDAFAFATRRPGDTTEGVEQSVTLQDPLTGLIARLEKVRQHKQTSYQIDMLWGAKLVDERKACRLAG